MIEFAFAAALMMDPVLGAAAGPKLTPAVMETTPAPAPAPPRTLDAVAVTLECTARASGRVEGCKVLGETHPGLGFGEAAVALMRDAEVEASARDYQFARTIQFTP